MIVKQNTTGFTSAHREALLAVLNGLVRRGYSGYPSLPVNHSAEIYTWVVDVRILAEVMFSAPDYKWKDIRRLRKAGFKIERMEGLFVTRFNSSPNRREGYSAVRGVRDSFPVVLDQEKLELVSSFPRYLLQTANGFEVNEETGEVTYKYDF
jgi:hypothetical protein